MTSKPKKVTPASTDKVFVAKLPVYTVALGKITADLTESQAQQLARNLIETLGIKLHDSSARTYQDGVADGAREMASRFARKAEELAFSAKFIKLLSPIISEIQSEVSAYGSGYYRNYYSR